MNAGLFDTFISIVRDDVCPTHSKWSFQFELKLLNFRRQVTYSLVTVRDTTDYAVLNNYDKLIKLLQTTVTVSYFHIIKRFIGFKPVSIMIVKRPREV